MRPRQTSCSRWLIIPCLDDEALSGLRRLAPGTGVLVIGQHPARLRRRLRCVARTNKLQLALESDGEAVRVHDERELRRALLNNVPLVLLSPIFATASHPDWASIPRMRAAALARLANRRLIALGGMNARRYAAIAPLGFIGWAGISAFRT